MTLARKILLLIFLLLPLAIVTIYAYLQIEENTYRQIYEERKAISSLSANVIREQLDRLHDVGLSIATRRHLRMHVEQQQWSEANELFEKVPADFPYVERVFLTDTTGQLRAQTPAANPTDQNPGTFWTPHVNGVWQPFLSTVHLSEGTSGHTVVFFAVPIRTESEQVAGVLVLQVRLDKLLVWKGVGRSGLYVVDQKGNPALTPEHSGNDSLADYPALPAVEKALGGKSSVEIMSNATTGKKILTAFEPIPAYGWAVIVQGKDSGTEVATDRLNTIRYLLAATVVLALLLAAIILWQTGKDKRHDAELLRYAQLTDEAHVVILNLREEIIFWSTGMERLYQWKKGEAIGKVSHELMATIFPQPQTDIRQKILEKGSWDGELEQVRKDGQRIYVSSHRQLTRDALGNPTAIIVTNNDITDLKKAEAALAILNDELEKKIEERSRVILANERRFSAIVEHSEDIMTLIDRDGNILFASQAMERITGFTLKEVIGRNGSVLMYPNPGSQSPPYIQEALDHPGTPIHRVSRLRIKQGGYVWVEGTITNLLADKHVGAMVSHLRDVTSRIQAEERLRESEEKYRSVVENSLNAILVFDQDDRILLANAAACKILGSEFDELKRLGRKGIVDMNDPRLALAVAERKRSGRFSGEINMLRKGIPFPVEVSTYSFTLNSGESYISTVFSDLSDQKKLESQQSRYMAIVNSSEDAILSLTLEGNITTWNTSAEKLYLYSEEEVIGRSVSLIIPPERATELREINARLSEGHSVRFYETQRRRKNGELVWVSLTVSALRNARGEIIGTTAITRNITDRKQAKAALETSEKLYHNLFTNMLHGFAYCRIIRENNRMVDFEYLQVNRIYEEIVGGQDFAGRKASDVMPGMADPTFRSAVDRVSLSGSPEKLETFVAPFGKWLSAAIYSPEPGYFVALVEDITVRKNAAFKLEKSEKYFRALIENVSDGIEVKSESSEILYQSSSVERILGYPENERVGKRSKEFIHPDHVGDFNKLYADLASKPGLPIPFELKVLHKNGTYIWIEGVNTNLLNDPHVQAIVTTYRDVTNRKEADEEIRNLHLIQKNTSERLSTILDTLPASIALLDQDGVIVEVNQDWVNFALQNGLPGDTFGVGDNYLLICDESTGDNSLEAGPVAHGIREVLARRSPQFIQEYRCDCEDQVRWYRLIVTPLHDKEKGAVVMHLDITEQKLGEEKVLESEQRFNVFMNSSPIMAWMKDTEGRFVYVNRPWEVFLGKGPQQWRGKTAKDIFPLSDAESILVSDLELLRTSGYVEEVQHILNRYWRTIRFSFNELSGQKFLGGISIDITKERIAEEQLASSEKRFRALIENEFAGITLTNAEGQITYQSPGVDSITGYTLEERLGNTVFTYIHPEDKAIPAEKLTQALAHPAKPIPFSYRFRHKKGHYVWLDGVIKNQLNDPEIASLVSNYRDITERKEAEEKLKASENRFRSLIEHDFDGITLNNNKGEVIYQSPGVTKITGYSLEERKGKLTMELIHPDDQEHAESVMRQALRNPDEIVKFNFRVRHKLGHYFWVEGILNNLLGDPHVAAIVSNYRDVTERKAAEERLIASERKFRSLIENDFDGISLFDQEGKFLYQSPANERITGYTLAEAKGLSVTEFTHPDDLIVLNAVMTKLLSEPDTLVPFCYRVRHKNGQYVWIEGVAKNMLHDPYVAAIISNYQDVTARKIAEEEIRKLTEDLELRVLKRTEELATVNKELEGFTYSVSHDLRAPLRIIDGYSQILLEDYQAKLDEEGQQNLKVIMKNTKRMGQLIDDLLDFSRLGRTELNIRPINMTPLISEVLDELKTGGTSIPKNLQVADDMPASGDSNLLKQVWANLISNAIKYSGKKKNPKIDIGVKKENGRTIFYVKDNGAGFDMKYYDKLFGVFQRLHGPNDFTGTGVGLALSKRIIVRHGGSIWAEAKPDQGATFFFTLNE